jgi:transmembrane 9 superfamily protein 3
VFTSFWNYKFYYVYGFMLLVFIILLIERARALHPSLPRRLA